MWKGSTWGWRGPKEALIKVQDFSQIGEAYSRDPFCAMGTVGTCGPAVTAVSVACLPDNYGVASRPTMTAPSHILDVCDLRAAPCSVEAQPAVYKCQADHGLSSMKSACNHYMSALLPRPPKESCLTLLCGQCPSPTLASSGCPLPTPDRQKCLWHWLRFSQAAS